MKVRIAEVDSYTPDARAVAQALRAEDRAELWALGRREPEGAVRGSIHMSTEAYVAFVDERPVAVFGAYTPALGEDCFPWLLGTDELSRATRAYLPLARSFVAHLRRNGHRLRNVASADNRKTLVFLSRIGFDIGEPFTVATGAQAVGFSMEAARDV